MITMTWNDKINFFYSHLDVSKDDYVCKLRNYNY